MSRIFHKRTQDSRVNQSNAVYEFTVKGPNEFLGRFSQDSIKIKPTGMNGTPVDLAVAHIKRIQRVNDPGWKISPKLKDFSFELVDGTHISGLPVCKTMLVNTLFIKQLEVEFDNLVKVEKVKG